MDQNLKKKIVIVKGLIQKKEYKQALDELEVLMYKYQKAYQVHLMSGLCYEKIGKQLQAQKCYKQVIELKDDQPNAIKALCEIYTKRNDIKNATIFLQKNVQVLKKVDDTKYRQALVKLVDIYTKDQVLEKIYNIFVDYAEKQDRIGDDFAQIADAYFRVSIKCKSFNLQKFETMGFKGQIPRPIVMSARQKLNILLIDIVNYLVAVSKAYNLTQKDIANSLYEMKYYFPTAPCMLMLLLLDEYCVGQVAFSGIILEQIYKLLASYFKKEDNGYLNMEYTEPQIFTVSMVMSYEYLTFFKEFFTLDPCFDEFYQTLALKHEQFLQSYKVREDYSKKMNNFILKKCRYLSKVSLSKNVETEIQDMKKRIQLLEGSFLQQVIAKIAMKCFVNYQKLDDMKNMLKIRIKNLQEGDMVPHLYKYYVDYLIKIAKIYKILDQQISIYEAVEYINKYDPKDARFLIEGYWLNFSKAMMLENYEEKVKIALQQIQNVQKALQDAPGQLKSEAYRKIAVMKIFAGDFQVEKDLRAALSFDRSFQNMQCLGFYLFYKGNHQEALDYLKQAFIFNQQHYHTNRLIFILLFKLGHQAEAIDFVERIKEGFSSVFWINYVLALKYVNLKRYTQAEVYMNAAIQSFSAGNQKKYKFSYQKTISHEKFAFLYMIEQNNFSILYDEIIFPEQRIYDELRMVSEKYFDLDTNRTQIKLFYQMGQIEKILGRTTSAFNHLCEAFQISEKLTPEQLAYPNQRFQVCILQKQYATILFYMQKFRQTQIVISSAYNICNTQIESETNANRIQLLQSIQAQIQSLSFEVAVQRLSGMLKFQSHETVDEYLQNFSIYPPNKPSVNFLKGQYQFYILEYLHKRHNTTKIQESIAQYLNYFNLPINSISSTEFENKYFDLDQDKKQMVRQALEDYFVVKYISSPQSLSQKSILPLIQLFPRSTIFYIIFGMSTQELKLKTAAFLKCIQLDKESPISIDLLASLYLKQKNYLAAAKLFLKSLQMNILSSKCYLGLSICLFCIIGKSISSKDSDVVSTIHKSLVRINSYMEYLRTVDPSENYHLLKFLKLLVSDQQSTNFEIKTVLQSSKKTAKYKFKNTLIYSLLEEATSEWKTHNIWQQEGQVKIMEEFLVKFVENKKVEINSQCIEIARKVVENVEKQFNQLKSDKGGRVEFLVKQIQKILNQVCIGVNLALKSKFDDKFFSKVIRFVQQIQQHYEKVVQVSQQNIGLIKKLKSYLFQYILINSKYPELKETIKSLFQSIPSYSHFSKYPQLMATFQSQLFKQVLRNPISDQLRKVLSNHIVVNGGKKLQKGKHDYKVQLINNTHDNLLVKKETLKKMALLYRQPESIVGYVGMCWEQPNARSKENTQKWLKILANISAVSKNSNSFDNINEETFKKLNVLTVQIYSYHVSNYGQTEQIKKIPLNFNHNQKIQIQTSVLLSKFYKNSTPENLKSIKQFITKNEKVTQFVFLQLLSFITAKFEFNSKIQSILIQLIEASKGEEKSSFISNLLLLRFLYILHRPIKTQQDLISQIMDLQKTIYACQQSGVSQNTISILKCTKCLVSADYQNLQSELSEAAKQKIVTYSDQVIINFFEIMRLYKQVETNPNKDGVIEEFYIYIESMIALVRDPFYQGFFYSLKAMVNAIIVPDESFVHDRNLRVALMLSPYETRVFVKSPQH